MDTPAYPSLPRLNLFSHPVLLGLCRRVLSPEADPSRAPLSARRIEHARVEHTESLKQASSLRAELGIAQDKALAAQREAQKAELDLRIFEEQHPTPQRGRAPFGKRASPAQRQVEGQRASLSTIAAQAAQSAGELKARAETVGGQLLAAEGKLAQVRQAQDAHVRALRDELGAWILDLAAAGRHDEVARQLVELRRTVRGDLVVGLLFVLVELLRGGPQAARQALIGAAPIFEQHRDPGPRVLDGCIRLVASADAALGTEAGFPLLWQEAGYFVREQFTEPASYRLYQLVRVLGGQGFESEALPDVVRATLGAIAQFQAGRLPEPSSPDALQLLLAVHTLLRQGRPEEAIGLSGVDAAWQPARRQRRPPALMPCIAAIPLPAWPAASAPLVHAALACHVLLAARQTAHEALYAAWLAESYGWPKDDLYWWVLSTLKQDPALLRNLAGGPHQLFSARPL